MKAVAGIAPLEVELVGAALDERDAGRLARLAVRQRLSAPAQLELVFQGADLELAERTLVMVGLSARVRGSEGNLLFDGDVTAVEHAHGADGGLEVRIRGYDPLHRLRKRHSVRAFVDLDVAELAAQVVEPAGLTVDAREAGPRRRQVVQSRQSDLALLAEVASASGLYFSETGGTVELFSLAGGGDSIPLRLGDDLLEADIELNGDHAFDSLAATGWDPMSGRRFEELADEPRSGRTAGVRVPVADLGGDGRRTLPNLAADAPDTARAAAQAALDRVDAAHVVVRGVAAGNPGIRPGATIELEGVALAFAGRYVVTEATHSLDARRGYLTHFSTEPPPPLAAATAPGLAPGLVERVDDPEGLGRVAVTLPTLPSVETGWMRVLLPAVGDRSGLVALPSPGDEVLVLFPSGDPALGIVLGGLFGGDDAPDFGVVDGAVGSYRWRTRDGQEIELDQAGKQVRVRTPNGSAITLGDEQLSIRAATDLDIAAPGRTITIRARAVDFQRADS